MCLAAVSLIIQARADLIPDYRHGRPNALVCPENRPCFECDHATAKRYVWKFVHTKWDGLVVFLPFNKNP